MEHNNHNHSHQSLVGVGALWSDTFRFFSKKFKNLAIVGLPIITISLVLITLSELSNLISSPAGELSLAVLTLVCLLVLIIFSFLYIPALLAEINRPHGEGKYNGYASYDALLKGSYREGAKKFWQYLWLMILVSAVTFAGYVLFLLPGIYVGIMFSFAAFVLFNEGKTAADAMAASWKYVRGHWWAVFGRMLLLALASIIAAVVVKAVSTLLSLVITQDNSLVGVFIGLFDYLVFLPFIFAYLLQLYHSLKVCSHSSHTAAETARLKRGFLWLFLIGILFLIVLLLLFPSLLAHIHSHFERAMYMQSGMPYNGIPANPMSGY